MISFRQLYKKRHFFEFQNTLRNLNYDPRPRVHKETENEDQAQDQIYKLQLLDKKSCKFDESFTIFSGG